MKQSANQKALREIMHELRRGNGYVTYTRLTNVRIVHLVMGVGSTGREMIFWQHYGESANPANLRDLNWIIRKIFGLTPVEFAAKTTVERRLAFDLGYYD